MPLTPYMQEGVFDPTAIEAMTTAYLAACETLHLVAREDTLSEIVARKVIEIAGTGERDPARIRDLVLLAFKTSDQRSA